MNPYLKRLEGRTGNSHGKESEARLVKRVGARPQPNSGAMRGAKGDMSLGDFLLEAKSTVTMTLPIEYGWLVKIGHEALNAGKTPAVSVSFVYKDGKPQPYGDWVLVPLHIWKELVG